MRKNTHDRILKREPKEQHFFFFFLRNKHTHTREKEMGYNTKAHHNST